MSRSNSAPFFLHDHPDFRVLIENTAANLNINEPSLVEKDYWIMHVLWSLQQLEFQFHLKGGTSLSKAFECIHRFSEDIDIKIIPNFDRVGFNVFAGKNHDSAAQVESRAKYYDWLTQILSGKIPGINEIVRDKEFDDLEKYRSGGIRLKYNSYFSGIAGLKEGILLEAGFAQTEPFVRRDISSWAWDAGKRLAQIEFHDNRAIGVFCYEPKHTFIEKIDAVRRKYKNFKSSGQIQKNFARHYYDIYCLLDLKEVQDFLTRGKYHDHANKLDDHDAFKLTDKASREVLQKAHIDTRNLYFKGQPHFDEILERIALWLDKL